jgi:hypothetical protein
MAATATTLRDRVTFRQNEKQSVTADGPGTAQQGNNGTEYRYMLDGHRIMWVPEDVHRAIEAAAQQTAGNGGSGWPIALEITKRKDAPWEVVHLVDEPRPALGYGKPSPTSARPATAPPPAKPAPRPAPPTGDAQPYNAGMYTALCAAIRTAAAAEEFARSIGRAIAFETADVRAIAATLFIQGTKGAC